MSLVQYTKYFALAEPLNHTKPKKFQVIYLNEIKGKVGQKKVIAKTSSEAINSTKRQLSKPKVGERPVFPKRSKAFELPDQAESADKYKDYLEKTFKYESNQ